MFIYVSSKALNISHSNLNFSPFKAPFFGMCQAPGVVGTCATALTPSVAARCHLCQMVRPEDGDDIHPKRVAFGIQKSSIYPLLNW